MAVYRQIHVSFWQDAFVLELTPEEKYFYLYLMTNSKTTQCGVYEIPLKVMELETGYNRETVEKLLNRFIEYKKVDYNNFTHEICIKNWLKYNNSKSPSITACIAKEMALIKDPTYYQHCVDTVQAQSPQRGGEKKNNNNNNKKNNKKNPEVHLVDAQASEIPDIPISTNQKTEPKWSSLFDAFWQAYPKKMDKIDAEKAWNKIKPDPDLFDTIMAAVELWSKSDRWNDDGGQYIPYPSTWLNKKRWLDEYTEIKPGKGKGQDEEPREVWVPPDMRGVE